jgi:lysophospholipase L1-like esterase
LPERNAASVEQLAARVNQLYVRLDEMGVELIVLLVPYEIQISDEAARTYAAHNVRWSEGFPAGSTQRMLRAGFDPGIRTLDLMDAFVDPEAPGRSRAEIGVGEFFVYDKGDKLDWNHPNRDGHRRIAEFLIERKIFGSPHESDAPAPLGDSDFSNRQQ